MTAQSPTTTIVILGDNPVVANALALLLEEGAMAAVLGSAEGEG